MTIPDRPSLVSAIKQDVVPKSPDHLARLMLGGIAEVVACYRFVVHSGGWLRDDIVITCIFLLGGLGIVFTGSVVALLKAVPVPWKRADP